MMCLEALCRKDADVGGDAVAELHFDDVAHHQFRRVDWAAFAITQHLCHLHAACSMQHAANTVAWFELSIKTTTSRISQF